MGFSDSEQRLRAARYLALVNLTGFERKFPWQLSAGCSSGVDRPCAFVRSGAVADGRARSARWTRLSATISMSSCCNCGQDRKTVLFVTHSIPEAVFLSTKIVVMSPRPGRIIDIIDCNFPRHRTLEIRETAGIPEDRRSACASAFGRGIPMTSSALAFPVSRAGAWRQHPLVERYAPIVTIVSALIAIWYVAAVLMNLSLVRDGVRAGGDALHGVGAAGRYDERGAAIAAGAAPGDRLLRRFGLWLRTIRAAQPCLSFGGDTFGEPCLASCWVALLGIGLALMIVHSAYWKKACCPGSSARRWSRSWHWRRSSSWCLARWVCQGLLPKSIIFGVSEFLSDHDRDGEGLPPRPIRCSSI